MGIGSDIPRVDGHDKLSGRTRYVDDLVIEGLWHGAAIRSLAPRGRITGIHFDPSIDWSQFAVVDHRDIPGPNEIKLIENDQPILAADRVLHKYEPVVLIAHRSIHALRDAIGKVHIEIEPLPTVMDPCQPLTPELIQYGSDNVFKRIDIRKGDLTGVFERAAHVVEGRYATGSQEHVYLETQGVLAYRDGDRLTVQGSLQCPYYVLDALMHVYGQPADAFRVVQLPVGGGFGGKEEFPSGMAIHAALLCDRAKAPVKMIYDRQEDMQVTTKRHPCVVTHRTALDDDGRLLAMEIDIVMDGGAYLTLSPVVLSRGAIHAAGPYFCENVHIHAEVRLTNSPPYGAFRGFGAPQTLFAVERHVDVIARQIGMDSVELRRKNLLRPGQTTATGQVFRDKTDLVKLMDRALDLGQVADRKEQHQTLNATHPYLRRGLGLSTFYHGAGFTGSGEVYLASEVWVEGLPDGSVEVLTAQTDMGQGTTTILSQIAADALGITEDQVRIAVPDTSLVPNSGPTVASRTAMVVGKLVVAACHDLVARTGADAKLTGDDFQRAVRAWHAAHPGKQLRGQAKFQASQDVHWDEDNYRGDAYATYSWAANVAEVEIDLRTYSVRVTDYVALQEVGKVLNPTLARGQIQGGVVQGIGWALYEEVVLEDGAMKNAQMTNYIIPGSGDLPPIRVYFEQNPTEFGPSGAKGIGELPMDGPAPAIINAVCNALNTSINQIPLTPERLMEHLEAVGCG